MEDICASIRITAKKSGKFTTIFRKKLHKKVPDSIKMCNFVGEMVVMLPPK